jgi:diguanylate cyclase (GGDEF)-like protein
MPDGVPGWLNHVRSPLALADGDLAAVLALNDQARRLLGADIELPCSLAALIGDEAAAAVAGMTGQLPDPPPRTLICRAAARSRLLDIALSRLPDGQHLLTILDRMAEKEAAAQLSAIEEEIHHIMEAMPVGVEIYDRDDSCLFMNAYGAALLGYEIADVMRLDDWWRLAYPDPIYRQIAIDAWAREVRNAREIKGYVNMADWIVTSKDGTRKLIHFRLRSLGDKIVLVYWDVTDHGRLVNRLRHLADTDPLTGVSNRRRFLEEAEAEVRAACEEARPVSLLMIDLDHFKAVNDRYGHAVGDLALREFVDKCRRALREQDLLARLGGEEFVALMRSSNAAEAFRMAEALCNFIAAAPMLIDGMLIQVTVSIGFAVLDARDAELPEGPDAAAQALAVLMRRADRALYAAKQAGRNQVVHANGVFLTDEAS